MEKTTEFEKRYGNFTSSEIVALTGITTREMTDEEIALQQIENPKSRKRTIEDADILDKKAMTYISEKNMERRLQRSLDVETQARPLIWGKFCENLVFDLINGVYKLTSSDTLTHKLYSYWRGTPDGINKDTVIDIKCPWTMKSFVKLVQPLYDGLQGMEAMNAIRNGYTDENGFENEKHIDGEKYYWQLVSNAVLTGKKYAELIVYCPYFDELDIIKEQADGEPDAMFINFAKDNELPYIVNGGYYQNLNVIRFEVPIKDKILLENKVKLAGKLLINNK